MKKAIKSVAVFANAMLSLVGLSFIAGTVAGAIVEGEGKQVEFHVGGKNIIDDNAEEATSAEEENEEVTEI